MTEYQSNTDYDNSPMGRKKEDFINYYKDFDSNFNKKDVTLTIYEKLLKVKLSILL